MRIHSARLVSVGRGSCVRVAMLLALGTPLPGATPSYEQEVRPLLKRHCLSCHGEEAELAGGLDLRLRRTLLAGGDSGAAMVPGEVDRSRIVGMVTSGEMPPGDQRKLTEDEVDLLRRWIAAGAATDGPEPEHLPTPGEAFLTEADRDHWSLKPLMKPVLPGGEASPEGEQGQHPIDRFIAARLREQGLDFAPRADRRTLIRRLSFDLLGLPPTPEEIDRFVNDDAPEAWERLVDRMLASPHYGERWARHWLDVVHFGETHGYDKDQPRPHAWPYRDYVIRAFNEDKPYARFVQEQLAGDVLFPHSRDGVEALGFLAAGPWDQIGHAEVPESKIDGKIARHLDRDDVVQNTVTTFLSLTIGCAQCHDHKFDPIPQSDYYSLQAVFAAIDRTNRPYDADPRTYARRESLLAEQRSLQRRSQELANDLRRAGGEELVTIDTRIAEAKKPQQRPPEHGYHSAIVDSPDHEKWVQVDLESPQAVVKVRLLGCYDDYNGIGAGFGFPVRFRVETSDDPEFESGVIGLVDRTAADVPNPGTKPVEFVVPPHTLRYVRVTATRLALRKNDYIFALAELELLDSEGKNLAAGKSVTARDSIEAPIRWRRSNLVDGLAPDRPGEGGSVEALQAQRRSLLKRVVAAEVLEEERTVSADLRRVNDQLAKLPPPMQVYAGSVHYGSGSFRGTGSEGGRPRPIHLLSRGEVTRPGREIGPGALACLEGLDARFDLPANAAEGERRAALARWITDPRNPLTWRSIVNRVWQYHFSRGIVDPPGDFGRMGGTPSHPELLDWLAADFRDGGQSLKELHRLIVTSRAWQQASRVDEATLARGEEADADNRLLWRTTRRQLEAEAVRDALLSVAGRLDTRMGGPSFQDFKIDKPQHSPHYQYHLHDPDDPASHRRSVYRFLVRSQTQPFMTALDCADPSMLVDRRSQSVSPLQALTLLNSGLTLTMSRHFANRLRSEAATVEEQLQRGCVLALGRPATPEELPVLTEYAGQHGLEQACRVLFNLNEFLFVD